MIPVSNENRVGGEAAFKSPTSYKSFIISALDDKGRKGMCFDALAIHMYQQI